MSSNDSPWRHPDPPLEVPVPREPHQSPAGEFEHLTQEELEEELRQTGRAAGPLSTDNRGMDPALVDGKDDVR